MNLILSFFLAAAGLAAGADSAASTLVMRVVEGDGAVYAVGSRATGGVTVLVTDAEGRPVDGATVSFSLPAEGPGGVFAKGGRTEVEATHSDGRAAAWGMQWNRTAGPFEIRITAIKGQARAAIVSAQTLSDAPADRAAGRAQAKGGGGNRKVLWIALAAVAGAAVAGAAVAGVAAGMGKSSGSGSPPATGAAATTIGAPTISLGHP